MSLITECDLDYLAARLHGRRSQLAEGDRLVLSSHFKSIPSFIRATFPETAIKTAAEAQRLLVERLIGEMVDIQHHLTGARARLMAWMVTRFQITNLKIMVRGILSQTPERVWAPHLITVPGDQPPDTAAITQVQSLEALIHLLPTDPQGSMLQNVVDSFPPGHRDPFFIEAKLDQFYFQEELSRAQKLTPEERDTIMPLVAQEIDLFHLMLVLRGKFHYGLDPKVLACLHVEETRLTRPLFEAMLKAPTSTAAVTLAVGRIVDSLPASVDFAAIEALAWMRYLKLARMIFRQSFSDFGVIAGYIGLKRIEIANLITLSEGIRAQIGEAAILRRMIPPFQHEVTHV
jgi:V/A-type H+-transporting ATPase subunit C